MLSIVRANNIHKESIKQCFMTLFDRSELPHLNKITNFQIEYQGKGIIPKLNNALDYLLKPIDPQRLSDAVQKLILVEEKEQLSEDGKFEARSFLGENDQVFVKDGEKCWFVKLSEIRLFESVGNYARVFFGSNRPLILKSLNSLEERLDQRTFFRANRKHIVNLRMIEKVEPFFNGGLLLEIKGGEKIEISRRQAVRFKEMMSL
jgi:two-component system LytT family response regulator